MWKVHGTYLVILNTFWKSRLTHVLFACNNHHNNGFHYGIFMPVYNVSPVTLPLTDPFSTALGDRPCCCLFFAEGSMCSGNTAENNIERICTQVEIV